MHEKIELTEAPFGERCFRFRHQSGLQVCLIPKKRTLSAAYLGVPAGSANESGKKGSGGETFFPDGTAHFLEHKLFENEDGQDTFEKFAAYGANANAFTSTSKTVYLFTCSEKESFLPCLQILIEGFLTPYFTEESIAKEREIITQEIKMYDDDPETEVYYGMLRGLYGDQPISRQICGSPASIAEITPAVLRSFHAKFYGLSSAVLCLCGDLTVEEILPILDELLPEQATAHTAQENTPAAPSAPLAPSALPMLPAVTAETLCYKEIPMPLFCIGLRAAPLRESKAEKMEDYAALSLLCQLLFSDFLTSLYEDGVVPEEPRFEYECGSRCAYLDFWGQAEDPGKVLLRFKEHMRRIAGGGFGNAEVKRAKKVVYAHYLRGFDDCEGTAAEWQSFLLDGGDLFLFGEALLRISAAELSALAKTILREENLSLSAAYPKKQRTP